MKVIVFIIYFFPILIFSQSKNNTFEIRNEKGIEYLVNKYENIRTIRQRKP